MLTRTRGGFVGKRIIGFLIVNSFLYGDLSGAYWAKSYGGVGYDFAFSAQQTSDSGYVLAGISRSVRSGSPDLYDILVIKLDRDGSPSWTKLLGDTTGGERAKSIIQTADGWYTVAGSSRPSGGALILRLTPDGSVSWSKVYKDISVLSLQQTLDSCYIISGSTSSYGSSGNDFLVAKLNQDGSVAWAKTYGDSSSETSTSIQQTADSGYIVTGSTWSFGAGGLDLLIIKLNQDGSVAWAKTYGGTEDDRARSIQQTFDGGFIVAGSTRSFGVGGNDLLIMKLNQDGCAVWARTFGWGDDDEAYSVQQTSDSGYVLTGTNVVHSSVFHVAIKLTPNGSVSWEKTSAWSSFPGITYSVHQTFDNGYLLVGYTITGHNSADFFAIKTGLDGEMAPDCPWRTTDVFIRSPTLAELDVQVSVTSPILTLVEPSLSLLSRPITTSTVCEGAVEEKSEPIGSYLCHYPTLFRSHTTIGYRNHRKGNLVIRDVVGREIKSFHIEGTGSFRWYGEDRNGNPVSPGIYFRTFEDLPQSTAKLIRL